MTTGYNETTPSLTADLDSFSSKINKAIRTAADSENQLELAKALANNYVNTIIDASNRDDVDGFNLWLHIYKASLMQFRIWLREHLGHNQFAQVNELINNNFKLLHAIENAQHMIAKQELTQALNVATFDLVTLAKKVGIEDKMPLQDNPGAENQAISTLNGAKGDMTVLVPQHSISRKNDLYIQAKEAADKRETVYRDLAKHGQKGQLIVARLKFAATIISTILTVGLVSFGMLVAAAAVTADKGDLAITLDRFAKFSGYQALQEVEQEYETKHKLQEAFSKHRLQNDSSTNPDWEMARSQTTVVVQMDFIGGKVKGADEIDEGEGISSQPAIPGRPHS